MSQHCANKKTTTLKTMATTTSTSAPSPRQARGRSWGRPKAGGLHWGWQLLRAGERGGGRGWRTPEPRSSSSLFSSSQKSLPSQSRHLTTSLISRPTRWFLSYLYSDFSVIDIRISTSINCGQLNSDRLCIMTFASLVHRYGVMIVQWIGRQNSGEKPALLFSFSPFCRVRSWTAKSSKKKCFFRTKKVPLPKKVL